MRKQINLCNHCLLFLCLALSSAHAQQVFKTTSTSVIGYLEYVPQGYNTNSDKYPIVIFLHGIGERGANSTDPATLSTTIQSVAKLGPPMYVKNGAQFPFILISPQLKSNYSKWSVSYVMEVINHVKTYLRIDERKIYLTGLSLGGGGVWVTAQDVPELFAAIAPVCGGYNSLSLACNIGRENLPVWAFHGDNDSTVPLSRSVNMVNAINACSPKPNPLAKMTIYPGVGNNAWTKAYKNDHTVHNPNVYEWMMSYTNTSNNGNRIPIANAGADLNVALSVNAVINGSGTDSDGSIASYSWTQISGPSTATLLNKLTKVLTASALTSGTYVFRLTVKDNSGNTDSDYVKVTVGGTANAQPVANAGADKTITLPTNAVTVSGSGTDSDGTIAAYTWSKVSGSTATLSGASTQNLQASNLVAGTYVFRLTVTDNKGAKQSDDMTVTVKTATTTSGLAANAGPDKVISLPANSLYLNGSGTAASGRVIRYYKWLKVSGPGATLNYVSKPSLYVYNMNAGTYVFKLTVTDDKGATASDLVQVILNDGSSAGDVTLPVENGTTVANAGTDKSITLPTNSLYLNGSGTAAPGSVIRYYKWSKVSGPGATLNYVSKPSLYVYNMNAGTYVFKLTVTDDKGVTASDLVQVTLNDGSSAGDVTLPVEEGTTAADAGTDKSITLPTNSLYLNGSGTAAPGRVIRYYKWSKISGPGASLNYVSKPSLYVYNMNAGIYVFKLTVTDDEGVTDTDEVKVTVKDGVASATSFNEAEPLRIAAVDDATEDQAMILGHLTSAQLENSTVVIFNDSGERIYSGRWDSETYKDVLNKRGLYIYNVIREGRRTDAGKIYIRG